MKNRNRRWTKPVLCLTLGLLVAASLPACKKSSEPPPASQEEVVSLDRLRPVLGEAGNAGSGIIDVTGSAHELIVMYRFHDADLKNYEDDMVTELAPKIEALYKKFSALDRVTFEVTANDAAMLGIYKPFMKFTMSRRVAAKLRWSGIMAGEFLTAAEGVRRY